MARPRYDCTRIMTISIEAIYEQGVLRLIQPIPLAEGTRVEITIATPVSTRPFPAQILAEIAALPLEGDQAQL
jgi:predicted DNA-binding antitoxin AbrB/MazE fold protein